MHKEAIKPYDPGDGIQTSINSQRVSPLKRKNLSQEDTSKYGNMEVQLKKPSAQKDSFCEGAGKDLDFYKNNQAVREEQNNYKKPHCERNMVRIRNDHVGLLYRLFQDFIFEECVLLIL